MLKFFLHIAQHSEDKLERRWERIQRQTESLRGDAESHLAFLHDTMAHLEARAAKVREVHKAASGEV